MPVNYQFTICHACHRFKVDGQQEWHEMIPEFAVTIKYLAKASLCKDCKTKLQKAIIERSKEVIFKEYDK